MIKGLILFPVFMSATPIIRFLLYVIAGEKRTSWCSYLLLIGLNFLVTEPINSNFFPEIFISFKGLSLLLKKNRAAARGDS
jgi:hypothetical protein